MNTRRSEFAASQSEFTKVLQLYIRLRFECRKEFPEIGNLPGAWDILLDMALAQRLKQPFRIADAEGAAGSSPISVLKALKALIEADMVTREAHGGYASFRVRDVTLCRLEELLTADYSH